MIEFWNENLPKCFTADKTILNSLDEISKSRIKFVITNGITERQKMKIFKNDFTPYFESVLISEEVAISKYDRKIYEIAMEKLDLNAEEVPL